MLLQYNMNQSFPLTELIPDMGAKFSSGPSNIWHTICSTGNVKKGELKTVHCRNEHCLPTAFQRCFLHSKIFCSQRNNAWSQDTLPPCVQHRLLTNQGHSAFQPVGVVETNIAAVQQHPAGRGEIEALDEFDNRALPPATWPHQSYYLRIAPYIRDCSSSVSMSRMDLWEWGEMKL